MSRLDLIMYGYEDLAKRYREGKVAISVDPERALEFFREVPRAKVFAESGEQVGRERATIYFLNLGWCAAALGTAIAIVRLFAWWSLLALPLAIVAGGIYISLTKAKGTYGISLTMLCLGAWITPNDSDVMKAQLTLALFLTALWFSRAKYVKATKSFLAFALRNERTFGWLRQHLHMVEVDEEA